MVAARLVPAGRQGRRFIGLDQNRAAGESPEKRRAKDRTPAFRKFDAKTKESSPGCNSDEPRPKLAGGAIQGTAE
jgi:hypothetical protein